MKGGYTGGTQTVLYSVCPSFGWTLFIVLSTGSARPTGPPLIHRHSDDEDDLSSKKIKLDAENEDDEFGFSPSLGGQREPHAQNGEVPEGSSSEELEDEDEEPPPIPPRSNSLSPDTTPAPKTTAEWTSRPHRDIYSDKPWENGDALTSAPTGHFLGSRGGGVGPSPQTTGANGEDENVRGGEEIPPPIPPKGRLYGNRVPPELPPRGRPSHEDEERALLAELTELERLVSGHVGEKAEEPRETEGYVALVSCVSHAYIYVQCVSMLVANLHAFYTCQNQFIYPADKGFLPVTLEFSLSHTHTHTHTHTRAHTHMYARTHTRAHTHTHTHTYTYTHTHTHTQ